MANLKLLNLEVIVGTYEEFLLGYKLTFEDSEKKENEESKKFTFKQSFTNHTHTQSIRSICTVKKYLASGSADESISLIDLNTRSEFGSIKQQDGTITALKSHDNFLFSGSEDGSICIWKTGSWLCEKTFPSAHQGGVIGIAIHPSGKLGLSIGKIDRSLKTWNLIKGRKGYITNLKENSHSVQWSKEGGFFAICIANRVDVYSVQTMKVIYTFSFQKRANDILFINEKIMLISGDKEEIEVHNIKKCKKLNSFKAHKNRVKDMKYIDDFNYLLTTSNDGFIKLWTFHQNNSDKANYKNDPEIIAEVDTKCRITCMTYHFIDAEKNKKAADAVENGNHKVEDSVVEIKSEDESENDDEKDIKSEDEDEIKSEDDDDDEDSEDDDDEDDSEEEDDDEDVIEIKEESESEEEMKQDSKSSQHSSNKRKNSDSSSNNNASKKSKAKK